MSTTEKYQYFVSYVVNDSNFGSDYFELDFEVNCKQAIEELELTVTNSIIKLNELPNGFPLDVVLIFWKLVRIVK